MNTQNTDTKEVHNEDHSTITVTVKRSNYNGWLVSENFLKRSLAVVGHYIVGSIIITFPFMFLAIILGGLS